MQRYRITSPLVVIPLRPSGMEELEATMTLPSGAVVEVLGPCELRRGMIEVIWHRQRYAMFELDLATRAVLETSQEM